MPPRNCCRKRIYIKKYDADGEFLWETGPTYGGLTAEDGPSPHPLGMSFAADLDGSYLYGTDGFHLWSFNPSTGAQVSVVKDTYNWFMDSQPDSTIAFDPENGYRMAITSSGTIVTPAPPGGKVYLVHQAAGEAIIPLMPVKSGTFTLALVSAGEVAGPLNWNCTALQVETALAALPSISDVTASGGPYPTAPIAIEYELAGVNELLVMNSSLVNARFMEISADLTEILQDSGTASYGDGTDGGGEGWWLSLDEDDRVYITTFETLEWCAYRLADDLSQDWKTVVLNSITDTLPYTGAPMRITGASAAYGGGMNVSHTSIEFPGDPDADQVTALDEDGDIDGRHDEEMLITGRVCTDDEGEYCVQGWTNWKLLMGHTPAIADPPDTGVINGSNHDVAPQGGTAFRSNGRLLDFRGDRILVSEEPRDRGLRPETAIPNIELVDFDGNYIWDGYSMILDTLTMVEFGFAYHPRARFTGGTFRIELYHPFDLSVPEYTTSSINYDASASDIEAALESLDPVGDDPDAVTVTLIDASLLFRVKFSVADCADVTFMQHPLMTLGIDDTGITRTVSDHIIMYDDDGTEQWDRSFGGDPLQSPQGGWIEKTSGNVYCWSLKGLRKNYLNGSP